MNLIPDSPSTAELFFDYVQNTPQHVFAKFNGRELTASELHDLVQDTVRQLRNLGIESGDRVAYMLDNNLDLIVLIFSLMLIGSIQIPINTKLRNDSLKFIVSHCEAKLILAEKSYQSILTPFVSPQLADKLIYRHSQYSFQWHNPKHGCSTVVVKNEALGADDVQFILYTSGTTGEPKGVLVTDRMLRAAADACAQTSSASANDRFLLWEPLFHIGALQILPLVLLKHISLILVPTFSASQFWECVRSEGVTKIHFLGGILQILLRQPSNDDRNHSCQIAWGGGAPTHVAKAFEQRFGIEVRENYGMTEASSLTSINTDGHKGSVGHVAPYFEVKIISESGTRVGNAQTGEILVRTKQDGLITPGYFNNPEATQRAIRNGWLHTGDLGAIDSDNYLYYRGRLKECIRRKGENISGWEIERVIEQHPIVKRAAAIGIPNELDDEDIKLLVVLIDNVDRADALGELEKWCVSKLPKFQWPQYLEFVDGFELTGTERIRKETLSTSIDTASPLKWETP